MLSFSLGPFVLAFNHLPLLVALALATLVGWMAGRRKGVNPERALFGVFLIGLLVARLTFVVGYWAQYRATPLSIIDIRDGGFSPLAGVIAVLIGALLCGWRRPTLRASMGMGVASGLLFWWLGNLGLNAQHDSARLPDLTLRNAAGETVQLSDYRGKPLVVNLWATWCPPCRREMPVLQAGQHAHPETVFLFVNQAESAGDVATFLARQGLHLENVLFDAKGELGQRVGSAALPTTLFYGHDGRLSGSHMGELSSASLTHYLDDFSEAAMPASAPFKNTPSRSTQ